MDGGVIRFAKNGNVVGVYAMEYLKQKGKREIALEESFELASRK